MAYAIWLEDVSCIDADDLLADGEQRLGTPEMEPVLNFVFEA